MAEPFLLVFIDETFCSSVRAHDSPGKKKDFVAPEGGTPFVFPSVPALAQGKTYSARYKEKLYALLMEASSETCQFVTCNGEPTPRRSLNSRIPDLYETSPEAKEAITEGTMRRNVKADHPAFGVLSRKLDVCEKCLCWDARILRACRLGWVGVPEIEN